METASSLRRNLNADVTVVGIEADPFARVLGVAVGRTIKNLAEANGVKFVLQRAVAEFQGDEKGVRRVVLDNGAELECVCWRRTAVVAFFVCHLDSSVVSGTFSRSGLLTVHRRCMGLL